METWFHVKTASVFVFNMTLFKADSFFVCIRNYWTRRWRTRLQAELQLQLNLSSFGWNKFGKLPAGRPYCISIWLLWLPRLGRNFPTAEAAKVFKDCWMLEQRLKWVSAIFEPLLRFEEKKCHGLILAITCSSVRFSLELKLSLNQLLDAGLLVWTFSYSFANLTN